MKKKTMTLEEYTDVLAIDMSTEIFKFINFYEHKVGAGTASALVAAFLEDFTKQLVYNTLTNHVDARDFNATMKGFSGLKTLIQDAIAQAFSDGTHKFSGKNLDYYCTITPSPKPINKMPC